MHDTRVSTGNTTAQMIFTFILKVRFTDSYRTEESAYYFIEGLFGEIPEGNSWYERMESKDKILKVRI